jgi:hypothetical protein
VAVPLMQASFAKSLLLLAPLMVAALIVVMPAGVVHAGARDVGMTPVRVVLVVVISPLFLGLYHFTLTKDLL